MVGARTVPEERGLWMAALRGALLGRRGHPRYGEAAMRCTRLDSICVPPYVSASGWQEAGKKRDAPLLSVLGLHICHQL